MNYEEEIKKLKFHVGLLGESIDYEQYPTASLVISNNWSEEDLNIIYDIFDEVDRKLESGEINSAYELESSLKSRMQIGYQTVKSIVNAFYRNGQWSNLCILYAMEHMVVEFHHIAKDFQKFTNEMTNNLTSITNQKFTGEKTLEELTGIDPEKAKQNYGLWIPFQTKVHNLINKNQLPLKIIGDNKYKYEEN